MKIYSLNRSISVPVSELEAWNFFSNPHNLSVITPKSMNFKVLKADSDKIYDGQHIHYKVSNNTSALEIDLEKHQLVQFLRNRLKAKIELILTTDKTIDKKLTYTNKDKYNLLREKNPLIEELKNAFKLSI